MKKLLSLFLILTIVLTSIILVQLPVSASTFEEELLSKGFPKSYISPLVELHEKHPEWEFKAMLTGLTFASAVKGERSPHYKQLISINSPENLLCKCSSCYVNGKYVIRESKTWVAASKEAVQYYLDPRNFLNEKYIMQFEDIGYNGKHTKTGVEAILKNTFMYDSLIKYKNAEGKQITYNQTTKYSDLILEAAKESQLSAYYLASKILQEVGGANQTAGGVSGTVSPFLGLYNYFNIGAYSGAKDGLAWANGFLRTPEDATTNLYTIEDITKKLETLKAKTYLAYRGTKTYKNETYYKVQVYTENGSNSYTGGNIGYVKLSDIRTTYLTLSRPWSNPYKAIIGGAKYIANNFSKYQNTGYLQKFNVNVESGQLHSHEYMANVSAAATEAYSAYRAYTNTGILSAAKTLIIPVFADMPDDPSSSVTPNKISDVKVTKRTSSTINFSWKADPKAKTYEVTLTSPTNKTKTTQTTTTNSVSFSKLKNGTKYEMKVKAISVVNSVNYSGEYSATYTAFTRPNAIKNLTQSTQSQTSVTLSWTRNSADEKYNIYSHNTKTNISKKIATVSSNSYKVTKLTAGVTYYYKVSAVVEDPVKHFESSLSQSIQTATKPATPTAVSAKSSKSKKINFKWKTVKGSGYQVQWSTSKNFTSNYLSKNASGSSKKSLRITTSQSKKYYYVRVRAYKSTAKKKINSSWSKTLKVKVK